MKNKTLLKSLTVFIVMIFILSIHLNSIAVSQEDKKALQNQINEAKSQLEDVNDNKKEAQTELTSINKQIAEVEDEISKLKEDIEEINAQIEEKQAEIDAEEKEIEEKNNLLKQRLVALYEAGETSYLDVLFNSEDLIDFISGYSAIQTILEADTKLINDLEEQKNKFEADKKILETDKQKVQDLKNAQEIKSGTLISLKDNKQKEINKLSDEEKELQKEIEQYEQEIKRVESELAEIARKAAEAKNSNSSQTGYVYTGGKLTWPCPSYTRISSYFGYRGYSATGGVGSSNHKGIDMAAASGTSIIAAEAGTVVTVSKTCSHNYAKTSATRCSCGGGYGNYIMISHGNGLVTLYAHCTDINVSVGTSVVAGQKIGTVGCTGYSTGSHLHFSVLLNGSYVNPAPYLGM